MTGRGVRAGLEGRACSTSKPEAGPGPPDSPRPWAEAGGDSREHRDGRPHHAVGKTAPVHVHGAAARAAERLLVRLGRRRHLHFRHPGRGWRRRQQERRTPFRFRHAARAPLRPAPALAPLAWWRHFPEVGSAGFAFPPGIGAASLWARPAWPPASAPLGPACLRPRCSAEEGMPSGGAQSSARDRPTTS